MCCHCPVHFTIPDMIIVIEVPITMYFIILIPEHTSGFQFETVYLVVAKPTETKG